MPPPKPPPPGPPRPPRPPGPPPNCGRGKVAFRLSRNFSSVNAPVFSLSQSPHHLAKALLNSSRVRRPSLLLSAIANRAGPTKRAGPPPRPPGPPGTPSGGGGKMVASPSTNLSWSTLDDLPGSSLSNHASASAMNSFCVSFWSLFLSPLSNICRHNMFPGPPPGPPRPPPPPGGGPPPPGPRNSPGGPPRGPGWPVEVDGLPRPSPRLPVLIALRIKTLSPEMIGVLVPSPGILVFHFTFFVSLHSVGGSPVPTPFCDGPRQ